MGLGSSSAWSFVASERAFVDARVLLDLVLAAELAFSLSPASPSDSSILDPAVAFFFLDDAAAALLPPVLAALDFSLSTRASIVAPISLR